MKQSGSHRLISRKKRIDRHRRVFLAWMLLAIFALMHIVKDAHLHHSMEEAGVEASANDDGTTMKSSCVICDFTLHEAAQVSIDDFHPLLCFTVVTPYVITSQTVYRHIDAINSHSPPLVV